ncbi:hypothetical protein [Pectobacterium sp. B2J-2]
MINILIGGAVLGLAVLGLGLVSVLVAVREPERGRVHSLQHPGKTIE